MKAKEYFEKYDELIIKDQIAGSIESAKTTYRIIR